MHAVILLGVCFDEAFDHKSSADKEAPDA